MEQHMTKADYLATTTSNLGVVGIGLGLWDKDTHWFVAIVGLVFIIGGLYILKGSEK